MLNALRIWHTENCLGSLRWKFHTSEEKQIIGKLAANFSNHQDVTTTQANSFGKSATFTTFLCILDMADETDLHAVTITWKENDLRHVISKEATIT